MKIQHWIILAVLAPLLSCTGNMEPSIFDRDNLVAWCIVPFDAAERSPEERAVMLQELGIGKMAYDYRDRHIPSFARELEVLEETGIELSAVWLWIHPQEGDVLGEASRRILEILEESGTRTELWVGFAEQVFDGVGDGERLPAAVDMVSEILAEAQRIGCTIALYNHGGWFGEPENQVAIIDAIGSEEVRIVYNFHHGHEQLERFDEILDLMLPHLSTVNLNGMRPEGPKILPLGGGSHEQGMMKQLLEAGYRGPVGILGHTEGRDVQEVLKENLEGLESLQSLLR